MERKVVITGLGCMTSLGNDVNSTWQALMNGESGIKRIEKINTQNYPCQFGGEIRNFNARKSGLTGTNTMLKYNQYEIYSVIKAVTDYNWMEDKADMTVNCPIYLGNQCINLDQELYDTLIAISGDGAEKLDFSVIGQNLRNFPPLNGIKLLPTLPTHFVAKRYDIHGSANISYAGESSSIESILHAVRDIEMGYYEKAIAASTFSPFSGHEFLWYSDSKLARKTTIDEEQSRLSCPFDKNHTGIIYGEGAGVILLESEESAVKNGRKILAYVSGGTTNVFPEEDFYELTQNGFIRNMKATLNDCSLNNTDIDLIYANAPSYAEWDNAEIEAVYDIWKEDSVCVTSSKANIGFLGCASGMVDCVLAVQSLNENRYVEPLNFEQLECGLNIDGSKYFGDRRRNTIQRCLINSAGAGAHYSSIILEKGV